MELRTREGRAVLVRCGETARREVDLDDLPLDPGLPEALHEWARVVGALRRNSNSSDLARVGPLVARRGHQLAARLAASIGRPVDFVDPFTGAVAPVEPVEPATARKADAPVGTSDVDAATVPRAAPTPWGTGLTVAAATAAIVALMMLTLAGTLGETSNWLAFGAGVVLTAGMAPSVWLLRHVLIWRWVALGLTVGLGIGWICLPFVLG
ncbi:MAG: DUF2537 domain-containing protein [Pseudonocardiaceae bacterium]|nr:DUF2537 domain-containing protein [Pseudonocardiaceae bacterium]